MSQNFAVALKPAEVCWDNQIRSVKKVSKSQCLSEGIKRLAGSDQEGKTNHWSSHPFSLLFLSSSSLAPLPGRQNMATSPCSTLNFSLSLPLYFILSLPLSPPTRTGYVSQWERKYCGEQIKWCMAAKIIPRVPHCYCLTVWWGGGCKGTSSLCVCVSVCVH